MIYHGVQPFDGYGIHSDLSDLAPVVRKCTARLRVHLSQFDSIAVSGMSGVVVGSPVALRLAIPLVIIRKPADRHHNGETVVNEHRAGRWLFVDDFIASGATWERVRAALGADCAGFYLYESDALELGQREPWAVRRRRQQSAARLGPLVAARAQTLLDELCGYSLNPPAA